MPVNKEWATGGCKTKFPQQTTLDSILAESVTTDALLIVKNTSADSPQPGCTMPRRMEIPRCNTTIKLLRGGSTPSGKIKVSRRIKFPRQKRRPGDGMSRAKYSPRLGTFDYTNSPSRIGLISSQRLAMSGLCVTSTTAWPFSFASLVSRSKIKPELRTSRLPVGSSARMMAG